MTAPQQATPWPERRVESWGELQDAVVELADRCVFRGQGAQQWPLQTSFDRIMVGQPEKVMLDAEFSALVQFRRDGHLHVPPSVMPPNTFTLTAMDTYLEWLMLMQHYGAPTRLLDWSQSPFVSIYFAVIDGTAQDAALWYFESIPVSEVAYQHHGVPLDQLLDYGKFSAEELRSQDAPPRMYMATKKMRSQREVAQQGVFSFANRIAVNQQDTILRTCGVERCGRLVIPHHLKYEIIWRLDMMNVTAATLFPGLEGVSTSIRDRLRLAVAPRPAEQAPAAQQPFPPGA